MKIQKSSTGTEQKGLREKTMAKNAKNAEYFRER
jgi:hypothetical protein